MYVYNEELGMNLKVCMSSGTCRVVSKNLQCIFSDMGERIGSETETCFKGYAREETWLDKQGVKCNRCYMHLV